jgi:type I restriction enzyme, S subunit
MIVPNQKRPGYKKTKAGWIPNEWNCHSIKSFCKTHSGGTPSRKRSDYWAGTIPWATTAEIKYGTISETLEFITVKGLKESSAKLSAKGTLVLAMYGQGATRGRVAILGKAMAFNQACLAIIPKKTHAVTLYVYHRLVSDYHRLRMLSQGGNQENLSSELVKGLVLPLPSLPEQKKLAAILSAWDEAIEQMRRVVEAKKRRKKGLMQKLLTGKKRLPGFRGGWSVHKLGSLFTEREESGRSDCLCWRLQEIAGVIPAGEIDRKDSSNDDKSRYKRLLRATSATTQCECGKE